MRLDISLSAADRERYGGPEWVTFSDDALNDLPSSTLEEWEAELIPHDRTILAAMAEWNYRTTARSCRVIVWLALRMAGVDVRFADFDPKVLNTHMKPAVGGDADPPDPAPDTSSSPDPESPLLEGTALTAPSPGS